MCKTRDEKNFCFNRVRNKAQTAQNFHTHTRFNTDMDEGELKTWVVSLGEDSLPKNVKDASAFVDLAKIYGEDWIDIGLHHPATKHACTRSVHYLGRRERC